MENIEKMIEEKAKKIIEGENTLTETTETFNSFDEIQAKYLQQQVNEGKTINKIAEDFVKAGVTSKIIKDEDGEYEKFHKELAEEQKEILKESFKQDKATKQAETLTAKQQKAEAFYVSFRPILEFDFSHLIHRKDKNGKEEKPPKEYKDRSYGIPLMVLMLCLLVFPYCIFSIGLAFLNGLNAILEAIATFGKIARVIATTIFLLIIGALIIYCAMLGIDHIFGTHIVQNIRI